MAARVALSFAIAVLGLPVGAAVPEPAGLARHLRVAADEEPAFVLTATGAHLYECKARVNVPNAFGWLFVAPDATLYEAGAAVAVHRAANQWESSSDRSSVSGVLRATQASGADNLPWALIRAIPTSETGRFAGVTSIQRVNTTGGAGPVDGCNAGSVGAQARVNYSADYYFYKRRGPG
jgi:hypothetical protein